MSDRLRPGERLERGQNIMSQNGENRLEMQPDGNLVVYHMTHARWATGTNNGFRVFLQEDGNFVLYDVENRAIWASNTDKQKISELVMQDDQNLVLYTPSGQAIWATNTAG